jgi:hypothetical protein
MELVVALAAGLGLSAACGFRVFVPMLATCIGARAGAIHLSSGFHWLQSDPALVVLIVATVVEGVAYLVPWLDHLLDTMASPAALVAGTMVMGSVISDIDPWLKWTLAAIAGGGAAGAIQTLTVATRATSSATTAGFANPIFAIIEGIGAILLSLLAIVVPLLTAAAVIVLLFFVAKKIAGFLQRRRARQASS